MIITAKPVVFRRRSKRHWHRRTIILRTIIIGGKGTGALPRTDFVFIGLLWARFSVTQNRWIYAEQRPDANAQTVKEIANVSD